MPAGDAALLVVLGEAIDPRLNARVHALAAALAGQPGIVDLAPAYGSLLVAYDPAASGYAAIEARVRAALTALPTRPALPGRRRRLPVAYGGEYGPDVPAVAARLGLDEAAVVHLHAEPVYRVYMLGFAPGYSYLGELPAALELPRLSTPRAHVPAGSVAIAGRQTGVYSVATPGGWHLLGRTPVRLFDAERDPPGYLAPGDRVRFVPITPARFARRAARERGARPAPAPSSNAHLDVLAPGLLTTVQDLGRAGYARYGVPTAGAMDELAARAANRLVGNADDAAVLEITLAGPTLSFEREALFAVTGADLSPRLDGDAVPGWTACQAPAGGMLRFGKRQAGLRAYLAVAGGIHVPPVLGSAATYLRGEFGGHEGRALRAGERLAVGPTPPDAAALTGGALPPAARPPYSREPVVRVVLGPHAERFTAAGVDTLLGAAYTVSTAADRMGYRLEGPPLARQEPADILSQGMALGGIQVPGDGQPIILLADHQTTGGYPLVATVIRADLPLVAQLAPGDTLRFRAVSVDEARAAYLALLAALDAPGAARAG
ncbi:MAG TPA: 5-oxoprolinase subunit PxpB [Chloroflexota bacterium]